MRIVFHLRTVLISSLYFMVKKSKQHRNIPGCTFFDKIHPNINVSSKALLLLPLAVVLSFSVQAQLAFDQILIPTTLSGVDMIYVEDLDGDGDNDIVSVSEDSGISWYRNDGSQNFEEFIISTTTSITFPAIHVADTDGDGDKDIISSHDAISIYGLLSYIVKKDTYIT